MLVMCGKVDLEFWNWFCSFVVYLGFSGFIYGSAFGSFSARLGGRSEAHPRCKGKRGISCRVTNHSLVVPTHFGHWCSRVYVEYCCDNAQASILCRQGR